MRKITRGKRNRLLVLAFAAICLLTYVLFLPSYRLFKLSQDLPRRVAVFEGALTGRISGRPISDDLAFIGLELEYLKEYVLEVDKNASRLELFSFVPYFGEYARDLRTFSRLGVFALDVSTEIYGRTNIFSSKPSQDSLDILGISVTTKDIDEGVVALKAKLTEREEEFRDLSERISKMDPDKYAYSVNGLEIKPLIVLIKEVVANVDQNYQRYVSSIDYAMDLGGFEGPRNYLVLLYDSQISRPMGGYIVGYAVVTLENGNLKILKTGDARRLSQVTRPISGPDFLSEFFGQYFVYLEDVGYSSDLADTVSAVDTIWETQPEAPELTGYVFADLEFVKKLVEQNDAAVAALNNLSESATRSRFLTETEKEEIRVSMLAAIKSVLASGNKAKTDLVKQALNGIEQRQISFFVNNSDMQEIVNEFGLGKAKQDYEQDYLYITTYEQRLTGSAGEISGVKKIVTTNDTGLNSTIAITFESAVLQDVLISVEIPESAKDVVLEGGLYQTAYTYNEKELALRNVFRVAANSPKTIVVKYRLENQVPQGTYSLFLRKQNGYATIDYELELNGVPQKFTLETDSTFVFNL